MVPAPSTQVAAMSISKPPASSGRPDFSGVSSTGSSTASPSGRSGADFSGVRSTVDSTAEIVGGSASRYTVVSGDTLSGIAKAHYGKAGEWSAIFEANRDQLDDPDEIKPGQVLVIPARARDDD